MRIIGGSARGRVLLAPRGPGIRPTADRARETLFNVLGQALDPVNVLDLFAGTGALALEALSRGASRAVLVDSGKEAQQLALTNATNLGFEDRVELLRMPVETAIPRLGARGERFELVFADPPYASRVGARVLALLDDASLVTAGGWLVVEHDADERLEERAGRFERVDVRELGATRLSLYRCA